MREPKQDRSRETRDRILESAILCFAEHGWQATTTSLIADVSGVSRGALQHHFPTRDELVFAALAYLFENRVQQFPFDMPLPTGSDRFDFLVQRLLAYYASKDFKAALQIWAASTGEPELRERLIPIEERFARALYDRAVEVLDADTSDERTHRLIQTTLDLARGLGLADVLRDDVKRRQSISKFWASELRSIKRR